MIDVEIRGPVAGKEFEKLKSTLESSGGAFKETRVTVTYTDRGYNDREMRLEHRSGAASIIMHAGRTGERKEVVVPLAQDGQRGRNSFSDAVRMLAELGYKKATVSVEKVMNANYGGAMFSLFVPDDESYHYEAVMTVTNPTDAKEAKQKLEKLARNFKLPIWTPLDMLAFVRKLNETTQYVYDYDTDGPEHFQHKFSI